MALNTLSPHAPTPLPPQVRAARPIAAGEEVCINWLGAGGVLAPLLERGELLASVYGFECRWVRGWGEVWGNTTGCQGCGLCVGCGAAAAGQRVRLRVQVGSFLLLGEGGTRGNGGMGRG